MRETLKDKIIEVEDSASKYIIDEAKYNGTLFILANELTEDEKPTVTMTIYKVDEKNGELHITAENNAETIKALVSIFRENLLSNAK